MWRLLAELDGSACQEVNVHLPRFRLEFKIDLKKALATIGVHSLFDDHADLSGFHNFSRKPLKYYRQIL